MKTSISIKKLSLKYGSAEVFNKLNLDINESEFLVLLGPSGCGKSTLLNCIAGLLDINDGQIFISGKNVTWAEPSERGIGMVFQSYALYPQMTVRGNLSFALKNKKIPKDEIEKQVAYASKVLQIEELLDRKPVALSGGQRQRVAIGRALVRDVGVFLFDEPLSNLDAKLRTELRVELKKLHHKLKNTMVYVTHDQTEAMSLADRIVILNGGVIQQIDHPTVIYNKPANLFVAQFIGSPKINLFNGKSMGNNQFIINEIKTKKIYDLKKYGKVLPKNKDLVMAIRPEDIKLIKKRNGGIKGVINLIEPMGSEDIAWISVDGLDDVRCTVTNGTKLKSGETVYLDINLNKVSLYDRETEKRI